MVHGGRLVAVVLFAVLAVGAVLGLVAPTAGAGEHPHVRITDPVAGSTVSGIVTVMGNAWDVDGEIVKVLVGIDARERTLATDTSGNASWWTWEWTWDTTFFENGWHHIVAIAYDNSSLGADTAIEVYVDNPPDHAPEVVITAPDEGATVRGIVNITGNASDDHKVVVVKIRINVDGPVYTAEDTSGNGSWWSWRFAWDSRSVPNGEHVIYAKAIDDHEHVGWDSIHVKVMNEGGNTAPWVEITEPKQGSTVCGVVVIKGRAGDHDAGDRVEAVQVKVDAGDWQLATDTSPDDTWATWMFTWDATHADRTWHHIYARSFDGDVYSRVAVLEVLVKCDDHPENHRPEVRIDHPESGQEVQGAVLVHGRAWDPDHGDRVEKVWVRIDDGEWHVARDLTDNASWFVWGWVWDTTRYDNGGHRVCARAFDGDLYSELSCIEVKVTNPDTRPKVHIDDPEDGDTVHGIIVVHGTASDDHGVKLVQVRIDEREWHNVVDLSADHSWRTWAWEWDTRGVDNGDHVISARAWDGHQYSEVHRIVVTVENIHGGIFSVFAEYPIVTTVLALGGTFAGSLAVWRRRFGLYGSLR